MKIRTLFIIVGLVVVILWLWILYSWQASPADKKQKSPDVIFPVADSDDRGFPSSETNSDTNTPVPGGVVSRTGQPMQVRNFINDPEVKVWDDTTYMINEETGVDGPLYQIFYFSGGSFVVSLQDSDLQFARSRAETALQAQLGLSKIGMCSLQARVTVPRIVSENLSGMDLGFSFCPGSVILE